MTYNFRCFLAYSLESALGQAVRDIEDLNVDNYSDDGTNELAGEFAQRDARVTRGEDDIVRFEDRYHRG